MQTVITDGGRRQANHRPNPHDGFVRAIATVTSLAYGDVYRAFAPLPEASAVKIRDYLENLGFKWVSHREKPLLLRAETLAKLPPRAILQLSNQVVAAVEGKLYDEREHLQKPSRQILGYWAAAG
jgi:hypothetical protein